MISTNVVSVSPFCRRVRHTIRVYPSSPFAASMSSSHCRSASSPRPTLRADAQLIGLVGLAHAISHFSQLVLAPLFPWLKDAFNVELHRARRGADGVLRGLLRGAGGVGLRRRQAGAAAGAVRRARPAGAWRPSATRWRRTTGCCWPARWWRARATACSIRSTTRCSTARLRRRGWAMPTACTASPAAWAGRWRRPSWCRSPWPFRGAWRWRRRACWRWSCCWCCGSTARTLALDVKAVHKATGRRRGVRRGKFAFLQHSGGVDVLRLLLLLRDGAERGADLRARGGRAAARGAGGADRDVPDDLHGVRARAAWWWADSWRPTRRAASASSAPASAPRRALRWCSRSRDFPRGHGAGAVRRDGIRRRNRRAVARPAGQALDAGAMRRAASTAWSMRAWTSGRRWRRWSSAG